MQELCLRNSSIPRVAILRFSSVYGDRLRLDDGEATIIAKLAGWIRSGVTPKLFEDGRQLRDWVYVGDIVEVITTILHRNGGFTGAMNVCSGTGTSLLDACEILGQIMDKRVSPEIVGGFRAGDMRHCVGDRSRMTKLLGRDPVSFREGAKLAFAQASGG
jgi:dTDP-L-rhamnose 4-epimerase